MATPQELLGLFTLVVIVSASGALSPGPLTLGAIAYGMRGSWLSGAWMALGHSLVEYPLIILLSMGLLGLGALGTNIGPLTIGDALRWGAAAIVLYFAQAQLRNGTGTLLAKVKDPGGAALVTGVRGAAGLRLHPLLSGLLLTALNPYFIIWWFAVGSELIPKANALLGALGPHVLFIMHVWLDYAWLSLMAALGQGSSRILGSTWFSILNIALGIALLYFALGIIGLAPLP